MAFKTICRSLLEYASAVWDPYKVKHITQLEMVQNRAIRFICNLRGVCSASEARDSVALESLENRRKINRKSILLNIIAGDGCHQVLRDAFGSFTEFQTGMNAHHTRSQSQGVPPALCANSTTYIHSFLVRTLRETRNN